MQARMLAFWWTRTQHVNKNLPQSQTSKTAFFLFCFFSFFKLHPFLSWKMWTPSPFLFACESVISPFHTVHPDFWTPPPAASVFCNSPHPRNCSQLHPHSANTTQTSALGKWGSQILTREWIQAFGFIVATFSCPFSVVKKHTGLHPAAFWIKSKPRCCLEALNYIRLT